MCDMHNSKAIRFFIDPDWPECGETVIEIEGDWIDISYERPAQLVGPPYFCPSLAVRSCEKDLPNSRNYPHTMRYDWSDMEVDPEMGARVPFTYLAEAVIAQFRELLRRKREVLFEEKMVG